MAGRSKSPEGLQGRASRARGSAVGASNREALAWHKEEMAKLEAQELTPDELRVAERALLIAFGHRMAKGARQAKSQNSARAVLTREVTAEIAREHQSECRP